MRTEEFEDEIGLIAEHRGDCSERKACSVKSYFPAKEHCSLVVAPICLAGKVMPISQVLQH